MSEPRSKSFNFEEPPTTEPVVLEISGDNVRCVPYVDGLRLLRFTGTMHDPVAQPGAKAKAITDWFDDVVLPEDMTKFNDLCRKYAIDIDGLASMSGYLSDVYAEVPTKPAEPSQTGQGDGGGTSEEASSSAA